MSEHKSIYPFKCPYGPCPKSYTTKAGLTLHIKRNHFEKTEPEMWCPKCGKKMVGCIRYDKTRTYFHCPKCGTNVKLNDMPKEVNVPKKTSDAKLEARKKIWITRRKRYGPSGRKPKEDK